MTHEQISDLAYEVVHSSTHAEWDYDEQHGKVTAAITSALTDGWYKPDEKPKTNSDFMSERLSIMYKDSSGYIATTVGYYHKEGRFCAEPLGWVVPDVLYWRYDNAADILELLNEK